MGASAPFTIQSIASGWTMTNFCTVKDVTDYLFQETGWAGNNAVIAGQIAYASSLIRRFTRREWDYAEYVDFLDTADIDMHIRRGKSFYAATLREKPVDVSEANYPKVRYTSDGKWDNTADLPLTTYSVDPRKNQIIIYPAIMTYNARSLRVVYKAGYQTQTEDEDVLDVPDHIKYACIAQAAWGTRRVLNNVVGTNQRTAEERLAQARMTASGLIGEALALIKSEVRLLVGGNA